jgi:hypothetical protein
MPLDWLVFFFMHTLQYVKQLSSIEDCLLRIKKTNQSNGIEKLHAVDELS